MNQAERLIRFLVYLYIFLLPWQTRLIWRDIRLNDFVWEYGRLSLYGTQLLLWLVLIIFLIWRLKQNNLAGFNFKAWLKSSGQVAPRAYWLAVLFFVISGLSIFWSGDWPLAYYRWLILLQAGALMAVLLNLPFKFRSLAKVWVAAAAVQGIFAISQFFQQAVGANKWLGLAFHLPTLAGSIILETDTGRWLRAYGSLPHPNILAGFLLVGFFLLLYLGLTATKKPERVFVLASLLAIVPGLFFSFSRSAWLALLLSLFFLAFWLWRAEQKIWRRNFIKLFFLIVLLVAILAFNFSSLLAARLGGGQELEVNSIELRFAFTRQALTLIQQYPWQGIGLGHYTRGVFENINATWPGYYYQPVHNIFLLAWAELGIFGLLIFSYFLFYLLIAITKTAKSPERVILGLILLSLLIISLFDHYFWTLEVGVAIFWLIVALNIKYLGKNLGRLDTS